MNLPRFSKTLRTLNCEVTEIIIIIIYYYSYQIVFPACHSKHLSDIASQRSTERSELVLSNLRFTEVSGSTFSLLRVWVLGFSPGVMRRGRDVVLSAAPSADVKNTWSHTMLSWRGQGHLYLYPLLSESCDSTFTQNTIHALGMFHILSNPISCIPSYIIYVNKTTNKH